MGLALNKTVRQGNAWAVDPTATAGEYATKEAAFEAIAGVASNAIKEGHKVWIQMPGTVGEPSLGSS